MVKGVSFTPSQTGSSAGEVPLAWTANPFRLLLSDVQLCLAKLPLAAMIFWPLASHPTDELYPTWMNMWTLAVHIFLTLYQTVYLISIPALLVLGTPAPIFLAIYALGLAFNQLTAKYLLNGTQDCLHSNVDLSSFPRHPSEEWIFCNGVAVGHHWLQANLDRLALTFRRPVRGVLNETNGPLFDLIQCLVERNFAYATNDVRAAYREIKSALLKPSNEKVILILHSQGGIQGSLVVDWLLDEFPHSTLAKLEIFTFGNAANHFNNPVRDVPRDASQPKEDGKPTKAKAISYIEHYGNDFDFVARWGVFHYTSIRNRYMGRIFRAPASGHLLNQHYLDGMFTLEGSSGAVKDGNDFMNAIVDAGRPHEEDDEPSVGPNGAGEGAGKGSRRRESRETLEQSCCTASHPNPQLNVNGEGRAEVEAGGAVIEDVNSPVQRVAKRASGNLRVKDFSRLWQYRSGRSPPAN